MGDDLDAHRSEQALRHRAGGDAGGGLAGRGSLEHVTGIDEVVLLHAGEVSVTRARLGERLRRGPGGRRHLVDPGVALPVPLAVADLDGDGRSEGAAVADAPHQRDDVLFEAHAGPAPVAEAAPLELDRDVLDRHRQPGRDAFDDDDQRTAVRFAGGQEAEHRLNLPAP